MKQKNNKAQEEVVDVVFRVDKSLGHDVYALFPHEVENSKGHVLSYQHVGQHSEADYTACIASSRPATEQEYAALKAELEAIGYKLRVVKRMNSKKYTMRLRSLNRQIV
jgi:hypothetical protein